MRKTPRNPPSRLGLPPRKGLGGLGLIRPLSFPEAVAFDHDLVGVVREPIEGALLEDRVVEERDPLLDRPVAGHDRRGAAEELSIEAARARMNLDSRTLLLQDPVVVTTPRDEVVRARQVVFSDELEGLYLPTAGEVNGRRFEGEVFLVAGKEGRLSVSPRLPDIDYGDFIEKHERVVLTRFLKSAPRDLKPFLVLMFADFRSGVGGNLQTSADRGSPVALLAPWPGTPTPSGGSPKLFS